MTPEQILQFVKQHYKQLEEKPRKDGWSFRLKGTQLRVLRAGRLRNGSSLVLSVSEKLGRFGVRNVPFYGGEFELRALLDKELEDLDELRGVNSVLTLQRRTDSATKSYQSVVTDSDLERLAWVITPLGQRLKWRKTGEKRLVDGVYIEDSASLKQKWVLSIYRNVNERSNDVEIAVDVDALVDVADGDPARVPDAWKWLDWQRNQLTHADHRPHHSAEKAFRIGLKLRDAWLFLKRLQDERSLADPHSRWSIEGPPPSATAHARQAERSGLQRDHLQATITRMLGSARAACAQSGKLQTTIAKTKLFCFEDVDARHLLELLLEPGTCAVTGIALDFSGADHDLAPSLDRIDSNGNYEPANVQIVAWFVNRWKSDDSPANFGRLLRLVAQTSLPADGQP
jgi:hypothetical protein